MQRYIYLVVFFLLTGIIVGQNTTYQDSVIYEVSAEDALFMRNQEVRYLIKLSASGGRLSLPKLQGELKLGTAFSLEYEGSPRLLTDRVNTSAVFGVGLGGRYYYNMVDKIKSGQQANNLSGEYIGVMAGVGIGFYFDLQDTIAVGLANGYSIAIGRQERYYKNEYFDFSLNLDYNRVDVFDSLLDSTMFRPGELDFSSVTLRTESVYGFAFTKSKAEERDLCAVINCYKDRKSGFKINRNNFFVLSRAASADGEIRWRFQLQPEIGYELKIAESSFSWTQTLETSFNFSNFNNNGLKRFGLSNFSYNYEIGGRYYYQMTEKILTGEQGNNLTGSYMQLYFRHRDNNQGSRAVGNIMIGGGVQKEVTNRLYFDLNLGLGARIYGRDGNTVFNYLEDFDLDFAVGYLF